MRLFNRRPRDLVSIEEYAAHRGVSTDTIYRYIRQGKIQRHKDGIDQVRGKPKEKTITIGHTHCPFCGERYRKEETANE